MRGLRIGKVILQKAGQGRPVKPPWPGRLLAGGGLAFALGFARGKFPADLALGVERQEGGERAGLAFLEDETGCGGK